MILLLLLLSRIAAVLLLSGASLLFSGLLAPVISFVCHGGELWQRMRTAICSPAPPQF